MEPQRQLHTLTIPSTHPSQIVSWHVAAGERVHKGTTLCSYVCPREGQSDHCQLKSGVVGVVSELLATEGVTVEPGADVVILEEVCDHSIVVFDLCADCGLNLRKHPSAGGSQSNVSMVHSIPEIRISQKEAELLGNKDKLRLLQSRKLALIVDLDQTLIHTSVDPNIEPGLPDVYGFNLPGHSMLYHCRLRPHVRQFLEKVSQLYEMHVFTMATNSYAAAVANILDPEKKLFCDRIISRDECFDPRSKVLRLKSVFPCGDAMVAIIDDREDVWGCCPNLVHVKPYIFFAGTEDINAPPRHERPPHRDSVPLRREVQAPPPHRTSAPPTSSYSQHKPFKTRHLTSSLARNAKAAPKIVSRNPMQGSTTSGPTDLPVLSEQTPEEPSYDERTQPVVADSKKEVLEIQHVLATTSPPDTTCSNSDILLNNSSANTNTNNNNNNTTTSQENGNGNKTATTGDNESTSSSGSSDTEDSSSSSGSSTSGGIDDSLFDDLNTEQKATSNDVREDEDMDVIDTGPAKEVEHSSSISTSKSDDEPKIAPDDPSELPLPKPHQTQLPSSEKQSHSASNSKPEAPKVKKVIPEIHDPDDFLVHLGNILEQLHSKFYAAYDEVNKNVDVTTLSDIPTPDLKNLIPKMRKSVLKGANVLFTGVIPTNMPPERSREWNTARAFGATVHKSLVPGLNSSDPKQAVRGTTHVIVGKPGTSKLREAKKIIGMKIVNPKWLWRCAEQWKWNDEDLFQVQCEKSTSDSEMIEPKRKLVKAEHNQIADSNIQSAHENRETTDVIMFEENKSEDCARLADQDPFDDNGESLTSQLEEGKLDLKRKLQRLDSYISVSDEELEKMDAEVEAEIEGSSSSSSDSNDDLGTSILQEESDVSKLNEDSCSYDTNMSSRKRKRGEMEESSSSNSPSSTSNVRSLEQSEDEDASCSSNDEDDELANLLGVD